MTLATHILVAGATTKPFLGRMSNPIIFIIAILSHYLSDAIPHFDYELLSIESHPEDKSESKIHPSAKSVAIDLLSIIIDIAIGTTFLILSARPEINFSNLVTYSLIIIGGILPDALQPIYILWKKFPMTQIQNWHDFWHAKLRLKLNRQAVISQGALFLAALLINYFY